jgi:hypothetical protein
VLHEWLAPGTVDDFVHVHLHRQPYAGMSRAATGLLDWSGLRPILGSDPDVLVVARGELLPEPAPRSLGAVRVLMRRGIGVVVQHAERHDRRLAALAAAFTADLPGETQVQLHVTPGGTHGLGWHCDHEDRFIVQTAGLEDYYFREDETSPILSARLFAGDWLYVPAGWWHMATCVDDSLAISVGVVPRESP